MNSAAVRSYLEELPKTVMVQQPTTESCQACGTVGATISVSRSVVCRL